MVFGKNQKKVEKATEKAEPKEEKKKAYSTDDRATVAGLASKGVQPSGIDGPKPYRPTKLYLYDGLTEVKVKELLND